MPQKLAVTEEVRQRPDADTASDVVLDSVMHIENVLLLDDSTSGSKSMLSLHEVIQKKPIGFWGMIKSSLLKVAIESGLPQNELCFVCESNEASHRCLQCSSSLFYCFSAAQATPIFFHRAKVWRVP